jgi:hypothetical protein
LNEKCKYIVVAFGGDTYRNDKEVLERSRTCIDIPDYIEMGKCIADLGLPTMVVQEGGYDMNVIGSIVTNFLRGLSEKENDILILPTKKVKPVIKPVVKSVVKSGASSNVFSTRKAPVEKNYDNGLKSEDSDSDMDSDANSDVLTLPVKKVESILKAKSDSSDSDDSNDSNVLDD